MKNESGREFRVENNMELFPVRCQPCNKVLGHLQNKYEELVRTGDSWDNIMRRLGIRRECCMRSIRSPQVFVEGHNIYEQGETSTNLSVTRFYRVGTVKQVDPMEGLTSGIKAVSIENGTHGLDPLSDIVIKTGKGESTGAYKVRRYYVQ